MKPRTLLVVAVAALAAASSAQGFRGGMMRAFSGGPMAQAMLLNRPDVQEELKISDEQKGKLDEQRASIRQRMQSLFQGGGGFGGDEASRRTMMTKMQDVFEGAAKDALSVLSDDQRKRLKELTIQSAGSRAVLQADVSKELGVTEAQKARIDELQRYQEEATSGLFEQRQNGEIDTEQMQTSMAGNTKKMDAEIAKVLTPAQRDKLKAMGGAAFEFKDPKPGTPGSWGRPSGGG